MKKVLYAITVLTMLIFVFAGCASTSEPTESISAPETEAVSETIDSTPEVIETAVPAEMVEKAEVIEAAPEVTASEPSLDEQFSFAYGYLLVDGLKEQNLPILPSLFVQGSDDFFNGVESAYSDSDINTAFEAYQGLVDQSLSEEEFALAGESGVSPQELFSYGYGYIVQFNLQSQGIIVDLASFNSGMSSSYGDIPFQYTDEEVDQIFQAYIEKLNNQYAEALSMLSEKNLEESEAFLAENAMKEEVITTDSGLQYTVVREGDGASPTLESTVVVDYQITFLDGSIGDNSYSRGAPSEFPLTNLIGGFKEGLPLMSEGAQYRFFIHPSLAYGEAGNEQIPPNTLLIFDVELHEVK